VRSVGSVVRPSGHFYTIFIHFNPFFSIDSMPQVKRGGGGELGILN